MCRYAAPVIDSMLAVGIGSGGGNVTIANATALPRELLTGPAVGGFTLQVLTLVLSCALPWDLFVSMRGAALQ